MTGTNRRRFAIILAAGDGKRMKSDRPKVLCEVLFKPMLCWVADACREAGIDEIYIVAGEGGELLRDAVPPECRFFCQEERLGTGHAVMMAREALSGGGDAVVLYGDAPFVSAALLDGAYNQHVTEKNALTLVSAVVPDPAGYGRVLRGEDGKVLGIVEQKDADARQQAIREINAGVYWFDAGTLEELLPRLTPQNAQGEYYLTDTVGLAVADGLPVGGHIAPDARAVLGANSRRQLHELNEIARREVLGRLMDAGAEIPCTDGVLAGPEVVVGRDALILPGTILRGRTVVGPRAVIGPNSKLVDSEVGEGSVIDASYLTGAVVGKHARVGPFAQLRPNTVVADGVKIGDFVEIKNSTIGERTSIAHLTYIGDSDVGRLCNFGCGVVTANYDGRKKYRTVVGDRAFIGCNTNLIPPVTVGEGAYTAAGTTVDKDVPAGALAVGRARQQVKEGWADAHIAFKAEK